MAFCTECGHRSADGSKFCEKCGTPTKASVTASLQPAASAAPGVPFPEVPTAVAPPTDAESQVSSRQLGAGAAVVGGILLLLAMMQFNSITSQIVRAAGGTDSTGLLLLIAGGVLAFGGAVSFFGAGGKVEEFAQTAGQGASAIKAALVTSTSAAPSPIEQLERLGALKEKGLLSEAEFEAQKKKLLA